MAILSMVTHPANMVMTIVPRAVAAFAGFERIQAYLLRPRLVDERQTMSQPVAGERSGLVVQVEGVQVAFGEHDDHPILKDISLDVNQGSLVIVSGPVGSGKSILLRTILGEIGPTQGSIQLGSRRVAYCAQRPWLPNGSIRQAICGLGVGDDDDNQGGDDERWYHRVVEACCLIHDLEILPDGDETLIGSGGMNLSGGQRQRVVSGVHHRCVWVVEKRG